MKQMHRLLFLYILHKNRFHFFNFLPNLVSWHLYERKILDPTEMRSTIKYVSEKKCGSYREQTLFTNNLESVSN